MGEMNENDAGNLTMKRQRYHLHGVLKNGTKNLTKILIQFIID